MADSLKSNTILRQITGIITILTIILHDLHLICSFIITYPLYFSYVIYFFPYVIKLISFISPLFIATVFLSILITTTTSTFCPNLKLGIVKTVVQELKLNLNCGVGDEDDCDFEEFEIYKIVFDRTLLIMICDESDEEVTECLIHGGRSNDVMIVDSDFVKLGFEKFLQRSVYDGRKHDVANSDSDVKKLDVEKITETSVHECRKSDEATSNSDVDKLVSVYDSRNNDVVNSDPDVKKLGVEKITETSVHECRKSDAATSNSDVDKLVSVYGSRNNDVASSSSDVDRLGSAHGGRKNDVAICNSEMNKSGIEKLIEELDKFEDFTPVIKSVTDSDKVKGELLKPELTTMKKVSNGSEAINSINHEKLSENSVITSSWRSNSSSIVNSYGSMREDKEWRKTLACKLFEERHNSLGGEEGMDSLWESYENDNSKKRKEITKKNISGSISFDFDTDTHTDTDEVVMSNGHLCCLQALKLSTGKMNLGMGKPNIVKITKAFKGFGWLNNVKNKHGCPNRKKL